MVSFSQIFDKNIELYYAAKQSSLKKVREILADHSSGSARDKFEINKIVEVETIVHFCNRVFMANFAQDHETALHCACSQNDPAIVLEILAAGADVNMTTASEYFAVTPL